MKGIILAGGAGTRLHPVTKTVSKQLLPIYDKPMIYYPLSILMDAGIKEVLIISTPEDLPNFEKLLGDGSKIGMKFNYIVQPKPEGLAQAFILGENFIGDDNVCLILGDNVFYVNELNTLMKSAMSRLEHNATIFGYYVNDPERYGVATFDTNGNVTNIDEKPENPESNYAIVGLYFYPNDVIKKAKELKPSARGELEITAINQLYLDEKRLNVELLHKNSTWLDTGTHSSLLEASQFIKTNEKRTGIKIACIEEIAFKKNFISKYDLENIIKNMGNNEYAMYLKRIIE
tara:strand:- start:16811 stop:17677 length:867 start_codon:yes stop_codon:yes gene_type:complete